MELELLAPAGDYKSFKSALNNGADAIYLGLDNFNARAKAENFNKDNIREVVKQAHFFGAKIYVTVNTLVNDNEFDNLIEMIKIAVDAKVDAFIIQDLGVAKVLKEKFEGIILHASTQLGIHNLEGAKVAEKIGFSRIVLSREIRLEDIKLIKENTNLEIEYFVQGALCVCFSGNCYISSLLSNESGNRGRCLQYCRMDYSAYDGDKKINQGYLLSAKDLSLIDDLKTLIDAGVCSFKIEGRLRRAGYVAKSVEVFRTALDNIIFSQNKKIDKQDLNKVFVRGDYNKKAYLYSNNDNIIEQNYNNHSGIKIGKVIKVIQFKNLYKIEINSNVSLQKGDGLKFYDKQKEIGSLGVGNYDKLKNGNIVLYSKAKVYKDNIVHLILDNKLESDAENKERYVVVDFEVKAKENEHLKIVANSNGIIEEFESDFICEKAKTNTTCVEEIKNQISKTKDYGFEVYKIEVCSDNVFIPKSVLNNLRRVVLEKLKDKIITSNEKNEVIFNNKKIEKNTDFNYLSNDIIIVKNIEQLNNYLKNNKKIINICLKPDIYDENILIFVNYLKNIKYESFILYLPVFADFKDIRNLKTIIEKLNNVVLFANNIYGLWFVDKYKVIAGTGLNIYNQYAVSFYKELGISDYVSSIENYVGRYSYSYGYFPLMTFVHCPVKANYKCNCSNCKYKNLIYENRNKKFKISRIKNINCQFELLSNSITENMNNEYKVIDLTNV